MDDEKALGPRHVAGSLVVLAVLVGAVVALAVTQGAGGAEPTRPATQPQATSQSPVTGRQNGQPPVVEGGEHGEEKPTFEPLPPPGTPAPLTPATIVAPQTRDPSQTPQYSPTPQLPTPQHSPTPQRR
ncbi:hypothetical protein [Dactylosporangium sp. NPDC006015]|uniref:hypothetical protein n=1 Tax=Dactylosporangium sp. NPDC006015 TaxID=3154576 RepID=UPI0033B99AB3